MTKTKKPRKKNPQDTTFRNLNALKRRVAKLEHRVGILAIRLDDLDDDVIEIRRENNPELT